MVMGIARDSAYFILGNEKNTTDLSDPAAGLAWIGSIGTAQGAQRIRHTRQ